MVVLMYLVLLCNWGARKSTTLHVPSGNFFLSFFLSFPLTFCSILCIFWLISNNVNMHTYIHTYMHTYIRMPIIYTSVTRMLWLPLGKRCPQRVHWKRRPHFLRSVKQKMYQMRSRTRFREMYHVWPLMSQIVKPSRLSNSLALMCTRFTSLHAGVHNPHLHIWWLIYGGLSVCVLCTCDWSSALKYTDLRTYD